MPRMGNPVLLLWNVAATSRFGFERHGRGPSVREGATFLRRPAPDANRPDPCNICGPRVIAERDRAIDSAAIRACCPVVCTIGGFDAALCWAGRVSEDDRDLRCRRARQAALARRLRH